MSAGAAPRGDRPGGAPRRRSSCERGRRAAREGVTRALMAGAAPRARASPRWRIPSSPILLLPRSSVSSAGAARCRARRRTPPSPHRPRPPRGPAPQLRAARERAAQVAPVRRRPREHVRELQLLHGREQRLGDAAVEPGAHGAIGVEAEDLLLELLLEVLRAHWRAAAAAADQRAQRARCWLSSWSPCAASSSSDSRSCGGPRCAAVVSRTRHHRRLPGGALGLGRRPRRHVEAVRRRRLEVAEAPLEVAPPAPGRRDRRRRRPAAASSSS